MLDFKAAFNSEFIRKKDNLPPTSDLKVKSTILDANSNNPLNSPGHCSSQDGSFIQDDDMRLILEFDGLMFGEKPATAKPFLMTTSKATSSTLMSQSSRRLERNAALFDANVVAHLDFDDLSDSRSLAPLYDVTQRRTNDSVFGSADDDLFGCSVLAERALSDINMSVKSLTSCALGPPPLPAAFISTDSLDSNCVSMAGENWQQFCAPNKREYVLTFDKQIFESGLAIFSTIIDSYSSLNGENDDFENTKLKNCTEVADLDVKDADLSKPTLQIGDRKLEARGWLNTAVKTDNAIDNRNNAYSSQGISFPTKNTYPKSAKKCGAVNEEIDKEHLKNVPDIVPFANDTPDEWNIVGEDLNEVRVRALNDQDPLRLINALRSNGGNESETAESTLISDEKVAYFSEQNLKETAESNTVTWQRIKHSYDQTPNFPPTSKCISLPNLKPSPSMVAKLAPENFNPIKGRIESTVRPDSSPLGGNCLLKAFQQQQQMKQNQIFSCSRKLSNQSESGYHTGTGSSNIGNFPTNIDMYTTADQCEQLLRMNGAVDEHSSVAPSLEWAEYYVNGRYVDMNHNEVDYVSSSDECAVSRRESRIRCNPCPSSERDSYVMSAGSAPVEKVSAPAKPPRIFHACGTAPIDFHQALQCNEMDAIGKSRSAFDRSVQTTDDLTRSVSIDLPLNSAIDKPPNLNFLCFPFTIPPLNVNLTPFLPNFLHGSDMESSDLHLPSQLYQNSIGRCSTVLERSKGFNNSKTICGSPPFVNLLHTISNTKGPDHIQDWDSLAFLLPADVVRCCRFFAERNISECNCRATMAPSDFDLPKNIDKLSHSKMIKHQPRLFGYSRHRRYNNSRLEQQPKVEYGSGLDTCTKVLSPSGEPVNRTDRMMASNGLFEWEGYCCDSETHQCFIDPRKISLSFCLQPPCCSSRKSITECEKSSYAEQKFIAKDPRRHAFVKISGLVQSICANCGRIDRVFRQSVIMTTDDRCQWLKAQLGTLLFNSLFPSIETLIMDGLSPEKSLNDLLMLSTNVATTSISRWIINGFSTANSCRERSLQFAIFVDSLLGSKSLGSWFSKLISNECVLSTHYSKFAFLRLLVTETCKSLYDSMFNTLELLTRLPFDCVQLISIDFEAAMIKTPINNKVSTASVFEKKKSNSCIGKSCSLATSLDQPSECRTESYFKVCAEFPDSKGTSAKDSYQKPKNEENLVVMQDELRVIFRFPANVTNGAASIKPKTHLQDNLCSQPIKTPSYYFPSSSPAQLANDSRIPKNSSSILSRLTSPSKLPGLLYPRTNGILMKVKKRRVDNIGAIPSNRASHHPLSSVKTSADCPADALQLSRNGMVGDKSIVSQLVTKNERPDIASQLYGCTETSDRCCAAIISPSNDKHTDGKALITGRCYVSYSDQIDDEFKHNA